MSEGNSKTIDAADADRLFGCLARYGLALLAVSGGPDSMALLHLVANWSKRSAATTRIAVATVDHCLRPDSATEARFVAEAARGLGFPHATLVWEGMKPDSGIQDQARRARYGLLAAHARSFGIGPAAVVTGHTANDQAETLLMRLARGSGLDGLSAMPACRPLARDGLAVDLVRPLLGVTRESLRAHLAVCGATFIDDPSNASVRFERVRLRRIEDMLAAVGLDAPRLALAARRLGRTRAAIDELAGRAFERAVDVHGGIYATVDRDCFAAEPEDMRLRLLARALDAFGGGSKRARLSEIETLLAAVDQGGRLARTLGGCVISAGPKVIRIYREPGREPLPCLGLKPGQTAIWDGRFRVAVQVTPDRDGLIAFESEVDVRPLSGDAQILLRRLGVARPGPARALETLPSFWRGDRLMAVPQLGINLEFPGIGGGHATCRSGFVGLIGRPGPMPDTDD